MNTRPDATTILCYGDSNTWGQKPDKTGRFPSDGRWTGKLQELLGDDYYIIEEGLSSRTTDLDYDRKPGRNGKTYLEPCLDSHNPIDVCILMLGTNDLKTEFNRTAADIAEALHGLVSIIKERAKASNGGSPRVILVSPIHIDHTAPDFADFDTGNYNKAAAAKSRKLAQEVQRVAEALGCEFVDAAQVATAGSDGLHLTAESHQALASLLSSVVRGSH